MRPFLRLALWTSPLLAFAATTALAHAVLTESSIGKAPLAVERPARVLLTFNSGIETTLTKVVLMGEDLESALETRAGNKATELLVDLPPLPTGNYTLHYKVLAADGHVTEAVLRFTVGAE